MASTAVPSPGSLSRALASRRIRALQARTIERWHLRERAIGSWEQAALELPLPAVEPDALVVAIARVNCFQWHDEDRARAEGISDRALGRVKRSIDASNLRRVEAIYEIDLALHLLLSPGWTRRTPLATEAPGSILDRLSVLSLKAYHSIEPGRRAVLRRQRLDLERSWDLLLDDLVEGRRAFRLYPQIKIYGGPADIRTP